MVESGKRRQSSVGYYQIAALPVVITGNRSINDQLKKRS